MHNELKGETWPWRLLKLLNQKANEEDTLPVRVR